jgi:malic enzyme
MLLRASRILATMALDNDLFENSLLYPDQDHYRAIAYTVAVSILDQALETGIARIPRPDYPLRDYVRNNMYYPQYP